MKKFTSSLDQMSLLVSVSISAFALFICYSAYSEYRRSGGDNTVLLVKGGMGALLVVLIAAMYLLRTRAITLSNTAMIIERPLMPVTVSYADIKSMTLAIDGEMNGVIRTFGNGGLFGYTGKYYNKKQGSMTWYCTRRGNYIIIEKTNGKKLVLSPDQPQELLAEVYTAVPAVKP